MNKLLIIDGLNLVRRIHAVLPDENDIASVKERTLAAAKKLLVHHEPSMRLSSGMVMKNLGENSYTLIIKKDVSRCLRL